MRECFDTRIEERVIRAVRPGLSCPSGRIREVEIKMEHAWSAEWCSFDEIGSFERLTIEFDHLPAGVSEAHSILRMGDRALGVTIRGAQYREGFSGFTKCPATSCILVFYGGMGIAIDMESFKCERIKLYPCLPPILTSSHHSIVHSYTVVAAIRSAADITYQHYDCGEIEDLSVVAPDTLVVKIFRPDLGGTFQEEKVDLSG
jgi:hypothetical protein